MKIKRKRTVWSCQRTLEECRRRGWDAGKVERFVKREGQAHGVRIDLFGWIDVIAVVPEDANYLPIVVAIQSCPGNSRKAHLETLRTPAIARSIRQWCTAGNAAELWVWAKRKKPGGVAEVWKVDRIPLPEGKAERRLQLAGGGVS